MSNTVIARPLGFHEGEGVCLPCSCRESFVTSSGIGLFAGTPAFIYVRKVSMTKDDIAQL